jgi:hypothetical protein
MYLSAPCCDPLPRWARLTTCCSLDEVQVQRCSETLCSVLAQWWSSDYPERDDGGRSSTPPPEHIGWLSYRYSMAATNCRRSIICSEPATGGQRHGAQRRMQQIGELSGKAPSQPVRAIKSGLTPALATAKTQPTSPRVVSPTLSVKRNDIGNVLSMFLSSINTLGSALFNR